MRQLVAISMLLVGLPMAGRALAQDQATTPKKESTAAKGKDEHAEPRQPPPADPKPEPREVPKPAASKESGFVDRDGDGIQDGKEHRFRGRHRQQQKKGTLDNGNQQRQQRGPQGPQRQDGSSSSPGRQNGRQGS